MEGWTEEATTKEGRWGGQDGEVMTGWRECLLGGGGGGAGKEEEEESGVWHDGETRVDGKKGGDTWKGGGVDMEGEAGKTGEPGRRGFPLGASLALRLLGSIQPSHIV